MPSHTLVDEQYCGDGKLIPFSAISILVPNGGAPPGGGSTTESGCRARLNVLISRSSSVKIPATDKN